MKLDKIFESIITEGISPIVYHSTDFLKLISILKGNKFILSPAVDSEIDLSLNKGMQYYFSTSRTRTASYRDSPFTRRSGIAAFITLDGNALGNRYKGTAVDFFGREDGRKSKPYEQEDRIISNKQEIPNAISYMKSIELFSFTKVVPSEQQIDFMIKSTGGRIPIYFYKDNTSFIAGDTRNALDLRLIMESHDIMEASYATKKWISENVPDEYKRAVLAFVNLVEKIGFTSNIIQSDNQVRTIAKLYNVDFNTLAIIIKKLSMFIM